MSRMNTCSPWTSAAAKRTKIAIRIANFETQITELQLVKTNTTTAVVERARQTEMLRCCNTESNGAVHGCSRWSYRRWQTCLLGVGKWRAIGVYLPGTYCDKVNCTYGGVEKN
jgi:hypothetical protein